MQIIDPVPAATGAGTPAAAAVVGRGAAVGRRSDPRRRRAVRRVGRSAAPAAVSGRRRDRAPGPADEPAATAAVNDAAGDNQVIIDVVRAVAPAVVTINVPASGTESQVRRQRPRGLRPAGHRLGRDHRARRPHPDQPPRRPGRGHRRGRARGRPQLRGHRRGHRHLHRPRVRQGRGHRPADRRAG